MHELTSCSLHVNQCARVGYRLPWILDFLDWKKFPIKQISASTKCEVFCLKFDVAHAQFYSFSSLLTLRMRLIKFHAEIFAFRVSGNLPLPWNLRS